MKKLTSQDLNVGRKYEFIMENEAERKKSTNDGELTPHDEKHNKHTNRRTKNQQTS